MKEINVAVTGGAGQIAYSLLPRLISGETFGENRKILRPQKNARETRDFVVGGFTGRNRSKTIKKKLNRQ